MCDEYEQKTRRREMLGEKLKKIKEDQGEIAVSREFNHATYRLATMYNIIVVVKNEQTWSLLTMYMYMLTMYRAEVYSSLPTPPPHPPPSHFQKSAPYLIFTLKNYLYKHSGCVFNFHDLITVSFVFPYHSKLINSSELRGEFCKSSDHV